MCGKGEDVVTCVICDHNPLHFAGLVARGQRQGEYHKTEKKKINRKNKVTNGIDI